MGILVGKEHCALLAVTALQSGLNLWEQSVVEKIRAVAVIGGSYAKFTKNTSSCTESNQACFYTCGMSVFAYHTLVLRSCSHQEPTKQHGET